MTADRWMLFVDGENLTRQAQRLAASHTIELGEPSYAFREDEYFWPRGWLPRVTPNFASGLDVRRQAERAYYYASSTGSSDDLDARRHELHNIGFEPIVFPKDRNRVRAKGVDIALTRDMLAHAFRDNYDVAVLVSGDGDYVPVIDEIKRLGRKVVVAFFTERCGLSPRLRLAADVFQPLGVLDGIFHTLNREQAEAQ